MKVMAFTDWHASLSAFAEAKEKAKDVDLIICTGDFTIFQNQERMLLRLMNNMGKPVLLVPGNHEDEIGLRDACIGLKNIIYLHAASYQIGEYIFFGYGGGGFSYEDKGFEKTAKILKKELPKKYKMILLTHQPPHNTKLDIVLDSHVGSKSYRRFIDEEQPIVAISGHIHECFGAVDKVKNCRLYNPGPKGRVIELH